MQCDKKRPKTKRAKNVTDNSDFEDEPEAVSSDSEFSDADVEDNIANIIIPDSDNPSDFENNDDTRDNNCNSVSVAGNLGQLSFDSLDKYKCDNSEEENRNQSGSEDEIDKNYQPESTPSFSGNRTAHAQPKNARLVQMKLSGFSTFAGGSKNKIDINLCYSI
ncbi:hypothetical protein U1Q18_049604 [Sarracenia purpurea var. burkii]